MDFYGGERLTWNYSLYLWNKDSFFWQQKVFIISQIWQKFVFPRLFFRYAKRFSR